MNKIDKVGEFPGGPVVRTLCFRCTTEEGTCSIPGWGTKIPQAVQYGQEKKKKTDRQGGLWFTVVLLKQGIFGSL